MTKNYPLQSFDFSFLQGGGEMGDLTRNFDWAATPLGPPKEWPQSLKVTVGIILASKFPMFLWWGSEMIQFYNDAYRPSLGNNGKHPYALGQRGSESWPEVWEVIYPLIKQVQTTGDATWSEDQLVPIYRNGRIEDVYWTFSYSPVWGESPGVNGVLVVCTETTGKVLANERLVQSAKNLHNMILQAPVAMCMLTGPYHLIEVANQQMIRLWGKPESAVLGHPVFDALPDARGQGLEELMAKVYNTGESFNAHEMPIDLVRNGRSEIVYQNFVYEPYRDTNGNILGVIAITTDVTEQVLAKKEQQRINRELSLANESFRNLILQAPVAMGLFLTKEMVIEVINDAFLALWDKDRSVVGLPVTAALPELENQPYPQIMRDVFNSGKLYQANEAKVFLHRNGRLDEGYYNFINQAFRNSDGMIVGVVVVAIEVTEQVKARQKLEQMNADLAKGESRLRLAIDATNLGTWEYDILSGEFYCSDECREIIGLAAGDAVTFRDIVNRVDPDDRHAAERIFNESAQKHNRRYDVTCRIARFDDDSTRWIKVQGMTLYGLDGRISRYIGTMLDATSVRQAEERSAKLAAIVDSSDDAIVSKTLESVITSWNEAAERMFEYSSTEMIGQTIYKIIPPDRQDEEPRILERLKKGERVEHFETKRLTKSGRLLDVSITVSPVRDLQGTIIGLSKIARDITEKKQEEQRKNDFIGMVSHELKTPLTSLNAIMQVTSAKLRQSADPFLVSAMERANVQVKRMSAMINGFLNVSRLEAGKMQIEKEPFMLDELLREVVDETGLIVTTHQLVLAHSGPVNVIADRDKISSVVTNIIGNAIKYSPAGKPIHIKCLARDNFVTVAVKDEGIGIKPGDLEKVFNRYYRAEALNMAHISGFGIGLYLSAEIIRSHGGLIWAESEFGKGSSFYFSLPLSKI